MDIEIKYGDLIQDEDHKVISVNKYFDSHIGDNIVARNSLHGQLIEKILGKKEEFDRLIEKHLFQYEFTEIKRTNPNGKTKKYPVEQR